MSWRLYKIISQPCPCALAAQQAQAPRAAHPPTDGFKPPHLRGPSLLCSQTSFGCRVTRIVLNCQLLFVFLGTDNLFIQLNISEVCPPKRLLRQKTDKIRHVAHVIECNSVPRDIELNFSFKEYKSQNFGVTAPPLSVSYSLSDLFVQI